MSSVTAAAASLVNVSVRRRKLEMLSAAKRCRDAYTEGPMCAAANELAERYERAAAALGEPDWVPSPGSER